jgi:hypothetical protein
MNHSWRRKAARRPAAEVPSEIPLLLISVEVDKVCSVQLRQIRPDIKRDAPIRSNLLIFSWRGRPRRIERVDSFGNKTIIMNIEIDAIGMLIQNDHRHPILSAMTPPNMGPDTVHTPRSILALVQSC